MSNSIARCVVLEQQPGSTTLKLRQVFRSNVDGEAGQLTTEWPRSGDKMKYTATYYIVNAYFILLVVRLRGFFCLESSTVE